jgi:hypothetical protein
MKFTLNARIPGVIRNPGLDRPAQRSAMAVVRAYLALIGALIGGAGLALRQGLTGTRQTATLEYSQLAARAIVTVAAPATGATVTINGTALTAAEHRANCTITVGTSVDEDDTVTVNGVVLTAKAAPSGNYQFAITGTAATDALALTNCINALFLLTNDANAIGITGKIKADRPAANGVVNLYAVAQGTAGNAYTIATSDAVDLAITNDDSGSFTGGAAATNNEFDHIGDNATIARAICDAVAASSTAAVSSQVVASCRKAIVACASVAVGDWVEIDGFRLVAQNQATDSGGARIATFDDDVWCQGSTDTNDGTSLVNCIHAHPVLGERFFAVNAAGTVSIYERGPESQFAPTISSNNGTRLAITVAVNGKFADSTGVLLTAIRPGLAGNINTVATSSGVTLAITQDSSGRLTGGTSTTLSF